MSISPKLPHPTRMVYEALRRRPDRRASTQELFEDIHRLWPTKKRAPGEKQPTVLVNGIPVYTRIGSTRDYPDHPIPSKTALGRMLLPYLASSSLVQTFAYKTESPGKKPQLKFAWRFIKHFPVPPHLPANTPAPTPLPASTASTLFQPIDVDGLIAMPPRWDSARKNVTATREEALASQVGAWQKLEGTFVRYPKQKGRWKMSAREPVPLPVTEQLALDFKTEVGTRLNKRRQRSRVRSTIQFAGWKDRMEEMWATKGPEMMERARVRLETNKVRRLAGEGEGDNGGYPRKEIVGGIASKYYFR